MLLWIENYSEITSELMAVVTHLNLDVRGKIIVLDLTIH